MLSHFAQAMYFQGSIQKISLNHKRIKDVSVENCYMKKVI